MNTNIIKHIARKVGETALHAAVFAYVSKTVSTFLDKKDKTKTRIETDETKAEAINVR